MTSTPPKISPPKLIGTLVIGLNILRRQIGAYPPGHPAVEGAADKVVRLLRHILREMESLTLAFSRDTVMWGPIPIERGNPVFHDYARALSSRGIAAMTFTPGISTKGLLNLNRILALKKEEIHARGGINAILSDLGNTGLEIQEVDYRQFRLVEGDTEERRKSGTSLWEEMVLSLFLGEDASASAAELAANLNAYLEQNPTRRQDTYATVITSFIQMTERKGGHTPRRETAEKLAELATNLTPDLREHFLMTAFNLFPEESAEAEDFFSALPEEVVRAAVEEVNRNNGSLPPILLGLLEKLGTDIDGDTRSTARVESTTADMADTVLTLLRPEQFGHFVPEVYQGKLDAVLSGDSVSGLSEEDSEALREMYALENLSLKTTDIILEISRLIPDENEEMATSLGILGLELLQNMEWEQLLEVCRRIRETAPGMLRPGGLTEALADAAVTCTKDRQTELKRIFSVVGTASVEPLLERLSHADNMAVRRFIMDCITGIGAEARVAILGRLTDPRWFVVRNLVIILRAFNDRRDAEHLRPLLRHQHPKVRVEALRAMLDMRDKEAEKSLAAEIERGARDSQAAAIQMAEKTGSTEIVDALLAVVEKSRDVDIRKLAVRTLATTGDARALPLLDRLLQSRSLLRSANLDQLKKEILRTLPSYPARSAAQLLTKVASRRDELGRLAQEQLRRLHERSA